MTTRPTNPTPSWANGGSAVRTPEPSASKRLLGWVFQEPVPFQWLNWWLYEAWTWLEHFATSASRWQALEDAVAGMVPGDTAIVDEYDADHYPGETLFGISSAGAAWVGLDVSGDGVFYSDPVGTTIHGVSRTDLTTQYPTAAYGTLAALWLACDGRYLAAVSGTTVVLYDAQAGGAALWSYNHGGNVNDVAFDGTRLYLVGDTGTGTKHARALDLATGAVVWSYDHGANLEAVCTDGRRVFVGGAASAYASLATVRCLVASNGYDKANEGGTGLDTTNTAWDLALASACATKGQLATDGRGLLVVGLSAGSYRIATVSAGNGVQLAQGGSPGPWVPPVSVDDRWIYAPDLTLGVNGRIVAYDKATLNRVWSSQADQLFSRVVSDGAAVWALSTSAAPLTLIKIARGNVPRVWRRVDPADDFLTMRQLIVPGE